MFNATKASISKLLHSIGYTYIKVLKYELNQPVQFQDIRNNEIVTIDWRGFVTSLKLLVGQYYIKRAKLKFKNRYSYFNFFLSPADYIYYTCPIHGTIKQKYYLHYRSKIGCPECAKHSKSVVKDTISFIEEANKIHENKYKYDKVNYKDTYTKVDIICPIHGVFRQSPTSHLSGAGCPKCSKITFDDFLIQAKQIHGNKYQYEPCDNFKLVSKIKIICPKHGEFWQEVRSHLKGIGCLKCSSRRNDTSTFIEKAIKVHGNKYDYSLVDYVRAHDPVKIICKKHGVFLQSPTNHLSGKGCSKCNESNGEIMLYKLFTNEFKDIEITKQKRFSWLGFQSLDFYFESYNIAVEFDGIQHFEPVNFFGGEKRYKDIVERDNRKDILCTENNVKLFRIKYDYTKEDLDNLINSIKQIIYSNKS